MQAETITIKKCPRCEQDDPTKFFRNKSKKDGLDYICKVCRTAEIERYRAAHPEKIKAAKVDRVAHKMQDPAWVEARKEKQSEKAKARRARIREQKIADGTFRHMNAQAPEGYLWCPMCKDFRPVGEFFKHKSSTTGYQWCCKPHQKEHNQANWGVGTPPENVEVIGGLAYIEINDGKTVRIDARDLERVAQHRWKYWKTAGGKTYVRALIDGRIVALHRFILDAKEGQSVDHINNDPLDNSRDNIRTCTTFENMCRIAKTSRPTSSKYKGVRKLRGKWNARIRCDGRTRSLGTFATEEEAALAYNNAAKQHFGEFAWLNEV